MSQQSYRGPGTQVVVQQAPSNSLGTAGFVLALVGWVSCGFLCPLGFLLSLFGLGKQPRGLAIAGTIIGGLGSTFLAFFGFALVMGLLGIGAVVDSTIALAETYTAMSQAADDVRQKYNENETLPGDTTGTVIVSKHIDGWSNPLRYRMVNDKEFELISNGPDGLADTADDVVSDYPAVPPPKPSQTRPGPQPTPQPNGPGDRNPDLIPTPADGVNKPALPDGQSGNNVNPIDPVAAAQARVDRAQDALRQYQEQNARIYGYIRTQQAIETYEPIKDTTVKAREMYEAALRAKEQIGVVDPAEVTTYKSEIRPLNDEVIRANAALRKAKRDAALP